MDKQFDFEQVGKRMPYNVPDGFFDQLEQNVMAKTNPYSGRGWGWGSFAAAAAIALFLVFTKGMPNDTTEDSFANVELAYNNLSTEDQEFLMEVYEEDEFINDNNEEDYDEDI